MKGKEEGKIKYNFRWNGKGEIETTQDGEGEAKCEENVKGREEKELNKYKGDVAEGAWVPKKDDGNEKEQVWR